MQVMVMLRVNRGDSGNAVVKVAMMMKSVCIVVVAAIVLATNE